MIRELAPAFIGILGVLVGGFVSAYATKRAEARGQALVAARLAQEGLGRWVDAIADMAQAPERMADKGDDYELYLAMEVRSLEDQLDDAWWREHGARLAGAATKKQWHDLTAASRATGALLRMIASIGDAGREALDQLAELEHAGRATSNQATGQSSGEPAGRPIDFTTPPTTGTSGKPDRISGEPVDAKMAKADQNSQDSDQLTASLMRFLESSRRYTSSWTIDY